MKTIRTLVIILVIILIASEINAESPKNEIEIDKKEKAEIGKLRNRIGDRFWVIGNNIIEFCEEPEQFCFLKRFKVSKEITPFVIKDLIRKKGHYSAVYKVHFDPGGPAFLPAHDFDFYLEQKYIISDREKKGKINQANEIKLKDRVGKRFWVLPNNLIPFYYSPSLLSDSYSIESKEMFTVNDLLLPEHESPYYAFYKITLHSGKEAYIWAYGFKSSFRRPSIITDDEEQEGSIEKKEKEIDAHIKQERNDADMNLLKEKGISKGKLLWLKREMYNLPWLSQVKIIDFTWEEPIVITGNIKVTAETKGRDIEMSVDFYSLDKTFYTSDPSKKIAKWGQRVINAIKESKVFIGMTKEQVITSWGDPDNINKSVGRWGKHEQWIYEGNDAYLYFENDKLTSIQQR